MSDTILTTPEEPKGGQTLDEGKGTPPVDEGKDLPKGDQGSGEPTSKASWIDGLPENLKSAEAISRFKSVEELAEAFLAVEPPPTIPEEYEVPPDLNVPEFAKWAKERKFTQEQVNAIAELSRTVTTEAIKAVEDENKRGLDSLFAKWGEEKDTNIRLARQFITEYDTEGQLAKLLDETRAGNNPTIVAFFANVGRAIMGEDSFRRKSGGAGAPETSAAALLFDKSLEQVSGQ